MLRLALLQALEDKYQAQISEADATIKIYLENSVGICLLYTSPSPRDGLLSRMPSSA